MISTRAAAAAHPVAAVALLTLGWPAAYAFALLHGAGIGVASLIAKLALRRT